MISSRTGGFWVMTAFALYHPQSGPHGTLFGALRGKKTKTGLKPQPCESLKTSRKERNIKIWEILGKA